MQPASELSYSQALAELEQILNDLRNNDCDIDRLSALTSRAVTLINHCRAKLTTTDEEIRQILQSLSNQT